MIYRLSLVLLFKQTEKLAVHKGNITASVASAFQMFGLLGILALSTRGTRRSSASSASLIGGDELVTPSLSEDEKLTESVQWGEPVCS